MGGVSEAWGLENAWPAAVAVTAAAYGVSATELGAASRGRGPRPAKEMWEARKMVVHLAVALAGCDYAELGRYVGLHRDTVSSHCASVRNLCASDDSASALAHALEEAATSRLRALSAVPMRRRRPRPGLGGLSRLNLTARDRLIALQRSMSSLVSNLSDDGKSSDPSDTSRTRDPLTGTGGVR